MDLWGYKIGRILGIVVFPFLILSIIGALQYIRTLDISSAKRVAFSWWAVIIALLFSFLSLIGQVVSRL